MLAVISTGIGVMHARNAQQRQPLRKRLRGNAVLAEADAEHFAGAPISNAAISSSVRRR